MAASSLKHAELGCRCALPPGCMHAWPWPWQRCGPWVCGAQQRTCMPLETPGRVICFVFSTESGYRQVVTLCSVSGVCTKGRNNQSLAEPHGQAWSAQARRFSQSARKWQFRLLARAEVSRLLRCGTYREETSSIEKEFPLVQPVLRHAGIATKRLEQVSKQLQPRNPRQLNCLQAPAPAPHLSQLTSSRGAVLSSDAAIMLPPTLLTLLWPRCAWPAE